MEQRLFSEVQFGKIQLKNRLVMAPMTRNRAIGNIPNDLMALYYDQRTQAGLIITEGTAPSPNGLGYARIPGIFSQEQAQGWKKVTDRVHQNDGKIFIQLMHTGRVSHTANMPSGSQILAPSAIQLSGKVHTDALGFQPYSQPQAMTESDIQKTIGEYVSASRLAIESGFDGVELHGANGYLIEQFLNTASNQRTDLWGSTTIENRIRFTVETARQVGEAIGFNRLGIRVSPYGVFNDMKFDPNTEMVYEQLARELGKLGLVYIHIVDHSSMGAPEVKPSIKQKIRDQFKGLVILSGGYDLARAEHDLNEQKGDLIAFGRPFISNPKLVTKLQKGLPLILPDSSTLYTPGEKGYTDYE